jgi:hypothetical protein
MTSVINSPFASPSPELADENRLSTTKAICAADTIHDFCANSQNKENSDNGLKNNRLFAKYIKSKMLTHMQYLNLGIDVDSNYKFINASAIENNILTNLNINTQHMQKIDYSIFDKDYTAKFLNTAGAQDKPFYFEVDDLCDSVFKRTFGALCSAAYNNNSSKIKFITDTNLLGDNVICSIEVNKNNPKKGMLIVSEASYYDSGTLKNVDDKCVVQRLIPVGLHKTKGNLFGLDKISLHTANVTQHDISNNNSLLDKMLITYSYKMPGRENTAMQVSRERKPLVTEIIMQNFIDSQKKKNSGSENRNKNLFKNVISMLVEPDIEPSAKRQRRGGGDKRKRGSSSGLIEAINKIYKLDFNNFDTGLDGIFQFMGILFDFKRAGDQLQIKSARKNKSVFISNDKISAAYAYFCGVPCIKTSPIGKKVGNAHRTRKLVFYGFKTKNIRDTLLNPRVMYKDSLLYHSVAIEDFIPQLNRFHDSLSTALQQTTAIKFKYPYINHKLQLIIDKSFELLQVTTDLDRRKCERFDIDCEIDKSRRFEYIYLLEYNIIVCLFLKYLLSTSFSDFNLTEITDFRKYIESLPAIDDATLNTMKEKVKQYDDDFRITFLHYFKLDDNTINFFLNVLQVYLSSEANILFEGLDNLDTNHFNQYTAKIRETIKLQNIPSMPTIPIISEYINCLNTFPRTNYNLIFHFPKNDINIEDCKFIDLKRATGKWLSIHNKIVELFGDSFQFLNKLATYCMKDKDAKFEAFTVQERLNGGEKMSRLKSSSRIKSASAARLKSVAKLISEIDTDTDTQSKLKSVEKLITAAKIKDTVNLKTVAKLVSASKLISATKSKSRIVEATAKLMIDSIGNKIMDDKLTPYELFLEQLNHESFENMDIDFSQITEQELDEIYGTRDVYTNQNLFTQDFYKIVIMFLIKTLKVFDDYGNLSEKYQDDNRYSLSRSAASTISRYRSRTASVSNRSITSSRNVASNSSQLTNVRSMSRTSSNTNRSKTSLNRMENRRNIGDITARLSAIREDDMHE